MTSATPTVGALLRLARELGIERLDAQRLLVERLHQSRSWLAAHDDAVLDARDAAALEHLLQRRAAGEPLAYLLGAHEFHGLTLQVTPDVLIPRADTEVLVDWALELLRGEFGDLAAPRVADLGTGSGAIALAVRKAWPRAALLATDVSAAALAVARANARRLGLPLELQLGSWWSGLAGRRFHLVLSNPPYIAGADPHLAALRHEPSLALTPGGDGLDALRAVAAGAAEHLEPGGWLLLEHGYDQADAVRALLQARGLTQVATRHDLAGQPRCTGGRRGTVPA